MDTLRLSDIFVDSTYRLIAVESVIVAQTKMKAGGYVCASVKPIAVVVCSPDGVSAFDMQARPASVEQLRKDIPDLDGIVSQHENTQNDSSAL